VYNNLNALAAYLAAEQHLPGDSPWCINRTLVFNNLRRMLPRALGLRLVAPRIVREVLAEVARNLQRFVSHRRRPRPPGPKPHKYHAYRPAIRPWAR
jgi:hypothetical protein